MIDHFEALRRTGRTGMPAMHWGAVFETVEAQVAGGQHLRHHDDLTSVHRIGKRHLNRFPIFVCKFAEFQLTAS